MEYTNYIKPELLVLVPVLVFAGYCLKTSTAVKDKLIPALLAAAGVVLAAVYVLASTSIATPQDAASAVFTAIVQGVLCAAGAVFADQVVKQGRKDE
nr:MAG TPA: holin [Bacteriophage sp.]DAU43570.1 MAG TPA: holin [Ackermannviridae sp.]